MLRTLKERHCQFLSSDPDTRSRIFRESQSLYVKIFFVCKVFLYGIVNRPGFSGEQSAERTSRRLEGKISCRIEGTPQGNQPNSAYAEFGCSREIVPTTPAAARRRGAAGPDQGAGAREQGVARRQRDPEEGVGLFCPSGARPPVPQMIAFIEKHREAAESSRSAAFC